MKKHIVLALLLLSIPSGSLAWNHPEIKWKVVSTEHFVIHYQEDAENVAREAARVAEESYGPITSFYDFEPEGKVHLVIKSFEDISSGATYYYQNKIEITVNPFDFLFRGTTDWLRNVITHEFVHIVSVQKAMKFPLRLPSLYFQVVSFEKEKRPDVLTGYPNFQLSFPFPGEVMPNWFAEGTAQYQCDTARHDIWDSHRDMLLRMAALNGRLLTLDELGVFGKDSRLNEMVYNQGFSIVRFIAERYGEKSLDSLVKELSKPHRVTFSGACKRVLGVGDGELYRKWKDYIVDHYSSVEERIERGRFEGDVVIEKGYANLYPVADGQGGIFFISNRGSDFLDLSLYRLSDDGELRRIASRVTSRVSLSPDGSTICYTKISDKNEYGYRLNDIFAYEVKHGREKRLTFGLRASACEWSPDGKSIACIVPDGYFERVAMLDPSRGEISYLTPGDIKYEFFGLSWGRKGILTTVFTGVSRDVALIDPATGEIEFILHSPADERDAVWSDDGEGFFYSSDRTGIFNIYYHSLADSTDYKVTDCLGGAFMPYVDGDALLFSNYGAEGFRIARIGNWRKRLVGVPEDMEQDYGLMALRRRFLAGDGRYEKTRSLDRAPSPSGRGTGSGKATSFEYTKLYVFPRFMIYEDKPRIGLSISSEEILGRQGFIAGGSINRDREFNLNLSYELRLFKPTFLFEVYRARKYYSYFSKIENDDYEFIIRYDLWDAYFHMIMEFEEPSYFSRNELDVRFNHGEYGLNIETWMLAEQKEFKGEAGWPYYKANEISLLYRYSNIKREIDADINPRKGRRLLVEVTKAYDKLHSGVFEFMLRPKFLNYYFGRYVVDYEEYIPLPFHQAISLRAGAGVIDDVVDDYFYLFIGGRDFLRGYSYYSLGGRKFALGRVKYSFPLLRRVDTQLGCIYLSSIYASLFAEAGKAWDEDKLDLRGNKKDVGFEIRAKGFSYYNFPLALSFEAAYGLNDIEYNDPFNKFKTFYEGKKWKFYGSVLFNF